MAALDFKVATLNTGLVRIELFNMDLRPAIPFAQQRRLALVETLKNTTHDLICLQEVYSRPQQQWFAKQFEGSGWRVVTSTDGAFPGQLNCGLVTLIREEVFAVGQVRHHQFSPADWTEVLLAPKGAMAVELLCSEAGEGAWFWLINLHTTYGGFKKQFDGPAANNLRQSQIRLLGQEYGHQSALFAGDFNCGDQVSPGAYTLLMDEFGAVDAVNHRDNAFEFRTWDPTNPLHDSIVTQRDNPDSHHGRIDQIFASDMFLDRWLPSAPSLIWQDAIVAVDSGTVPLSDHYGLELCVSAK